MRGASPDDLAVVAQRAQAFTNASGVAIALSEGNVDEIVCRARSGASAPDVGAALRVEGTFTGLCIQSGKELRCDDCETDTRVDMAAIRALGIRSMVVTPIREESRVVGVLAAFAPTPHAFTITHVAVLKTMADQIAVLLQKERRARDENPQPESPRSAAPAIVAKPVIAATPVPVMPAAVVIKPSPSAAHAAAPAFAKVEPIRSTPLEVVPLAMPPKVEKRADFASRANFGTFDSVADEEKKSGSKFMVVGVVAVLIVAAAATFTFLKMQKHGAAAPQSTQEAANAQPTQPSSGQPSSSQFAANQPSTLAPVNNTQPAVPASSIGNGGIAASTVIVAANTAATGPKSSGKVAVDKSFSDRADKPSPAEKSATVSTFGAPGQSRIAQQDATPSGQEVAPSFTVVSGNSGAPLTNLARPSATSTPTAAAMERSQLEPLQLIKTGTPVYPAIAKARSITGTVVVQGTVDKSGKVTNLQFISGQPIFRDAAFDAVRQYQFKPAKLNGQPIEQTTQIKLTFH
jgi:TonB family protein